MFCFIQSITVRWQPPPPEEQNGQITGYKIRYRKQKKHVQVETTPGNVRHFELRNLEKKSLYQVKIAAMTVNGTGPFTEWTAIETYESDLTETHVPGKPTITNSKRTFITCNEFKYTIYHKFVFSYIV